MNSSHGGDETIEHVRARLDFLPDGGVHLVESASGKVWRKLPPRATFDHLRSALNGLGYITDCPRQHGEQQSWPRRIYLLECMTPSFSIDLNYKIRLFVDSSASPSKKVQSTVSYIFAMAPERVFSIDSILSTYLPAFHELGLKRFNPSRPARDALFHCLYSLQRHLLPYKLAGDRKVQELSERLGMAAAVVAMQRVQDPLSSSKWKDYLRLVEEAARLCQRRRRDSDSGTEGDSKQAGGAVSSSEDDDGEQEGENKEETTPLLAGIGLQVKRALWGE